MSLIVAPYNAPGVLPSMEYRAEEFVRSPLNYTGGKYKLLSQILPLFPRRINTFVDLFCGGCNVGINVRAGRHVFNDNITYLIDLYNAFRETDADVVVSHIEGRVAEFGLSLTNKEGYMAMRQLYNTRRNALDLFVLVAYSFNHQIRFNSRHGFNNPFGLERSSFNATMRRNLLLFLDRIKSLDCRFVSHNFDRLDLSALGGDDMVYCDPPYLITTGTYNDGKRGFTGWSEAEERALLSLLSALDRRGVSFALSNVLCHKGKENTLLLRWVEDNDFRVTHLKKNYANSNYHTTDRRKTASDEVLITNY